MYKDFLCLESHKIPSLESIYPPKAQDLNQSERKDQVPLPAPIHLPVGHFSI